MAKDGVPKSYGLLLFPMFEVLDAAGPIELLNVLSLHMNNEDIRLSVIAETMEPVSPGDPELASHQFTGQQLYKPTHTFETAPPLDVLIVPGGKGARAQYDNKALCDFIRKSYHGSDGRPPLQYIFSICTGASLLADSGVLDGRRATSNKRGYFREAPRGPKTHWIGKARWVVDGNVWTTSGVSAGLDGMVALIAHIYDDETATKVCEIVEHPRQKDAGDDPFAELYGCKDILPVK